MTCLDSICYWKNKESIVWDDRSHEGGGPRAAEAIPGGGEPVPGRPLRQVRVAAAREEQGQYGRRRGHHFLSFADDQEKYARNAAHRSFVEPRAGTHRRIGLHPQRTDNAQSLGKCQSCTQSSTGFLRSLFIYLFIFIFSFFN